ncbi:MAG: BrnT family toxin [Terracidiphilus sp.]
MSEKHGVRFETAALIFEDPWILSRKDFSHDDAEERYNALGEIASGVVLFVVFTWRRQDEDEIIRLISSRAASRRERGTYEEARSWAEAGYRRYRRQNRRYD